MSCCNFFFTVLPSLFIVLTAALQAADPADLKGVIDYTPPSAPERINQRYSNLDLSELGPPAPPKVVVYLENDSTADMPPRKPEEPREIRQKGLRFYPDILPIQTGETVHFPNMDNTYHNVFSYSPSKRFDLGRYRKDESPPPVTFNSAGVINLFCEVHEHMRGFLLVLDTPLYTKTDEEGLFKLKNIPPGTYQVTLWLSPRKKKSFSLTLAPGERKSVQWSLP